MSQRVEIRHLSLVEGVAKQRMARRWQWDIKTVRRAVAQPGPVAGADRAVAGPGPAGDGEAASAAAVAVGRPGRRAPGAPVCGGVEGDSGAEA